MQLLDRDRELSLLAQALADAIGGHGRVALVTGEAGIGKTSLLRAFLADIEAGVRVLRCACEDLRVAEPLGPLQDLLRDEEPGIAKDSANAENLFAAFSDLLAVLSDHPGGTVIVIEDLHWADDATVDFVRFVARRVVDHPICLIVSARAEQAAGRQLIRRAFGDLPTQILFRIPLAPLSESAVAQLCRGSNRDPDNVYRASGGNAFYVTELLQNSGAELPSSIRDAVLARMDRLSLDARTVLETVSVVPRRAEIDHVEAVVSEDVDANVAIEQCLDAGLLLTDGKSLSFAHELAREAVLSSLSPLQIRMMNERFFRRLSEAGEASLSRLLHHAQGAGDDGAVAELAPRAARAAAAVGSRREAAAFFAIAVDVATENDDPDLLEEAAWSNYIAGEHAGTAGYQSRALARIERAGDPVRKGEALRKLSRYRWVRSDYAGAFDAINEAISVLSNHRGPALARAYSSLSQLHMTAYHFNEAREPANAAIALARQFEQPDVISHALNNLAMSYLHDDTDRARALMAESFEIASQLVDPDHAARALINWMTLEYDKCEFENALRQAEISADFARERELGAYHRYSVGMIARANHRLGRWDNVVHIATRVFDPDDRVPENFNFNSAIALFMHQVRVGEVPDPDLVEHLALYDRHDAEGQRIGPYSEMMAEIAWITGENSARAVERLHMVASKTPLPETVGGVHVWLKRLGETVELEDISRFPEPYRLELSGDRHGAASAWADRGARYEEAMTLAFGSTEDQARASEIFQDHGAIPAMSRLGELSGSNQGRRGRPAVSGPHGLTGRQLDVLALLGEGLTNSQIGESLFISPKTVDHHVSAILAKLDCSTRGEAAAKARKLGLI